MNANANRFLFSFLGVVIFFVIIVFSNFIASMIPVSVDFTEDNIYTLSEGTEKILKKIDTPVSIDLYVTEDKDAMPPQYQVQAREVESFLQEYVRKSPKLDIDGKSKRAVALKLYDPEPDTDEEDAARLAGIQGSPGNRGDIYFGLAISCIDQKVRIPFLPAIPEELLEYEVSRAITQVTASEKPVIGIMTSYELSGGGGSPFGGGGAPPWTVYGQLQNDFKIRTVEEDAESIDSDIKVLILLHPGGITELGQFAVDQYLLAGGKVVAFLDPYSITAARLTSPPQNPMQRQPQAPQTPSTSNIDKLLNAWGYRFESEQVVSDLEYKTPIQGRGALSSILTLPSEALDDDDVLTSKLNNMLMVFAGEFKGEAVSGLSKDILITSSKTSQLSSSTDAENDDEKIQSSFKSSGEEKILALRLAGMFETAFPDGKPGGGEEPAEEAKEGDEEKKDDDDKGGEYLKKSKKESAVLLVADSDLLFDQFCVRTQNFFGQRVVQATNGNLPFFQNVIEMFSGDTDLIAVRSRGSVRRPFTRVNEIEERANAKIRDRLQALEKGRNEAEEKINSLQAQKDDSQKYVLTPEQQNEIEKFEKAAVSARKERRSLQKEARAEYNSLIADIKKRNMFYMPALIAVIGIAVFFVRRAKTSAH